MTLRKRRHTPEKEIILSIQETRRIYQNFTEAQFTAWYARRYHVSENFILNVLRAKKGETA